ncbi:MAG: tRNA lysidine(34) synthetase TilS [Gammaproteobacteria bacterium]|nr:tRNA lysidine(34) synthetase TilS [Gammaproteobacteria bacterium]
MNTDDQYLIESVLRHIPVHLRHRPLFIGFSGGLDSTVLLHLLSRLYKTGTLTSLAAVHIHHGLLPQADRWVEHAEQTCRQLDIPLIVERIQVEPLGAAGIESAARKARYAALARYMKQGGGLLTAHHRDDQAETFLLQLMRGAGVRGLASMPVMAPFAGGWHLRPLIEIGREKLRSYALKHGLCWIEDPSNADLRHARNLVRHRIFPVLHTHWPQAEATLARAARRMAITEELLGDLGRLDLEAARSDQVNRLEAMALARLPDQRLFNAVRIWLIELGLSLPPEPRLAEIRRMLEARADALPVIRWPGGELRRWREGLYALRERAKHLDSTFTRIVHPDTVMDCPELGWRIIPHKTIGSGLRLKSIPSEGLVMRLRQGGERIRVVGQAHHQSLKNLFQASSIPPWERERLPLFFIGDCLVQVGESWIEASYFAGPDEPGLQIVLERLP